MCVVRPGSFRLLRGFAVAAALSPCFVSAAPTTVQPKQVLNLTAGEFLDAGAQPKADAPKRSELVGDIQDLGGFDKPDNPFGWRDWQNHASVEVREGVLTAEIGQAGTAPARLISDRYAYFLDPDAYRYLELIFQRETTRGDLVVYFRKDGNSVATQGQSIEVPIPSEATSPGDKLRVIVDMSRAPAWKGGVVTGFGLNLTRGVADSKNGSTTRLHALRLGSELSAAPGN